MIRQKDGGQVGQTISHYHAFVTLIPICREEGLNTKV